jgi:hypothetical protein
MEHLYLGGKWAVSGSGAASPTLNLPPQGAAYYRHGDSTRVRQDVRALKARQEAT